ncbi:hypothetical protein [Phocaeicola dorei]
MKSRFIGFLYLIIEDWNLGFFATFFVRHSCSPKESRAAEAATTQKRV